MNRTTKLTAFAVLTAFIGTAIAAPITAHASEEGKRNTAYGLGAAALLLMRQKNKLPAALAGAASSTTRHGAIVMTRRIGRHRRRAATREARAPIRRPGDVEHCAIVNPRLDRRRHEYRQRGQTTGDANASKCNVFRKPAPDARRPRSYRAMMPFSMATATASSRECAPSFASMRCT